MKNNHRIYIFFTALVVSIAFNELNIAYIKQVNPENEKINTQSLVHGSTIWSIDNSWYLPIIRHLLDGEGYTLDPHEPEMRVRRSPVYPLFYGAFYSIFGEYWGHFLIRYMQTLLFALSAVGIYYVIEDIFASKRWAIITGYTYALTPYIYSYCYLTLTESISPALVVLTLFFIGRYMSTHKRYFLILCGFSLGLSFLNRPTTGIILPGMVALLLFENKLFTQIPSKILEQCILGFSFLLFLSPWIIRNYQLTGEFIPSEKFYHGAPMDLGRGHIEFRYLVSSWTNPTNLSANVFSNKLRSNISKGVEVQNQEVINAYVNSWPNLAFKGFSREELTKGLQKLNQCFIEKHTYRQNNPSALRKDLLNLPCEDNLYTTFHEMRQQFKQKAPMRYYVLTPLKTFKEVTLNSFLHHVAMMNPKNSSPTLIQYVAKGISFLGNTLFNLSILYVLIFLKQGLNKKLFIIIPVIFLYVALIFLLFRYVETRYLLPIYPFLVIAFSFMLWDVYEKYSPYFFDKIFQRRKESKIL